MEDDQRASDEMTATIRSQRKRISTLEREQRLLKAMNEIIDSDIQEMQKDISKEQIEEYRLALYSCSQDVHEKQMVIKQLEGSIERFLTIVQELRIKNQGLEVQLEEAMMIGGPHVEEELGTVPHSYVEFSDVEHKLISQAVEEEKEQEPNLGVDVQTKSWWRRQVKKVVKGMGTFRLRLKRCLGVKTSKKPVARLINVQLVNSTRSIMNIGMPPVWWRRQAESLWKVVKRMGTFCLAVMRCQGLRRCMRQVIRSNQVHPVCDGMLPV